jgi:hypothetical protein
MGKKSVVPQKSLPDDYCFVQMASPILIVPLGVFTASFPLFFLMSRGRDYLNQAKWNNFDKLLLEASSLNLSEEVGTGFFLLY